MTPTIADLFFTGTIGIPELKRRLEHLIASRPDSITAASGLTSTEVASMVFGDITEAQLRARHQAELTGHVTVPIGHRRNGIALRIDLIADNPEVVLRPLGTVSGPYVTAWLCGRGQLPDRGPHFASSLHIPYPSYVDAVDAVSRFIRLLKLDTPGLIAKLGRPPTLATRHRRRALCRGQISKIC